MEELYMQINTIDDLVLYMLSDNKSFEEIEQEIAQLETTNKDRLLSLFHFLKERSSKPLSFSIKVLCLLIPYGFVSKGYKKYVFDPLESYRLGFLQKFKDYNLYSILGIILYTVLLLIVF